MTTDPPVPATLDLRGLPWMPLDVVRLRDSDLAMVDDAEVFRCSVLSWCVSWHQVPAASLPDDDAALARLLGYGRDLRGWRKVRAAGGLRGWTPHNDGRLYHPVVAAKALEAQEQQERSERKRNKDAERLRKWRSDRGVDEQEWREIRARVIERDGWCCTVCGSEDDLHCDHIIPAANGGKTELENLKTLCRACHTRKTAYQNNDKQHIGTHFITEKPNPTPPNRTIPNRTIPNTPPPLASAGALPAAAATGLRAKVRGYDPANVLTACNAGDLLALVGAFGGNLDRGDEWARDAAGQRIGTIAAVFDWRMASAQPIREPSGLRAALAEWMGLSLLQRKTYAQDFAKDIGLPVLSPGAERQAGGPA